MQHQSSENPDDVAALADALDAIDPEPGHHDPTFDPVVQYRGTEVDPAEPLLETGMPGAASAETADETVQYRGTQIEPEGNRGA